jgi:ATP-dependent helicase/nuclease subunit A
MSRVEIISASAGSGKTYRLAEVLDDAIASGGARPDAVLATTFTTKAAAELRERARTRLLAAGRADDAQRLAAARIGTVNAVCGRLVADFAFVLGLSPDQRVLDEQAAGVALRQAMSRVVTDEDTTVLADIGLRFDWRWSWQADVERIVTLARANGVPPGALESCARRSAEGLRALLGAPAPDGDALDAALAAALERFVAAVDTERDTTKKTAGALDDARRVLARLGRRMPLRWADWLRMERLDVAKRSASLAAPVRESAAAHDRHPRLHADLAEVIARAFGIAARTLAAYAEHKRVWGAIDFTDQEVLALELLGRPEVQAQLRGEIDLVLVDEFQDTSPLQLAIFLRLAALAKRSVWVGDQKQAIFGFRGTDPALMDAAVETILAGGEPETLGRSWRSRPSLVDLTSELFARAFARHGIPEARVRLRAEPPVEPPGLGPALERWRLAARNQDQDAAALAACVRALLADPTVRVRARVPGGTRGVRAGDVAILCYTNAACARVAAALAAAGVRAVLPRAGLMATPEARLVLAGLRLFVDPGDTLAAAELARLVGFPAGGDAWLDALLAGPGRAAFAGVEVVRRVSAAREARPNAGPLAALDAVLEAVEARERCLEWGEAPARLANLDALRAHAVVYGEICAAEGAGYTPAGLVAGLDDLARAGIDTQGRLPQQDAVVVSTWHSAKGLEWPIAVLFELDAEGRSSALGVQVASDRAALELGDPLAGRWIRFWPQPYHPAQKGAPFHQRLDGAAASAAAREAEERQSLRLLYVGWTRARDRLVLAGHGGLAAGLLAHLRDETGPLLGEPGADGRAVWGARGVELRVRAGAPAPAAPPAVVPGAGYAAPGARAHPPAYVVPSEAEGTGVVGAPERIGARIVLSGDPDMAAVGAAIHGFLAADRPGLDDGERRAIARGLLERWQVAFALGPDDLLHAAAALRGWAEGRWPDARWRREWPLLQRQPNGTVVRGTADLVLEAGAGLVLIDHKSFPGTREQAVARAAAFGGQLAAYAAALEAATGKPVAGRFIHLPVSGLIVPVRGAGDAGGAGGERSRV